MNEERRDVLDEAVLRRALRLESDERPPRFDAAAIAAAAGAPPATRPVLAAGLGIAILAGLLAGSVWPALFEAVPAAAAVVAPWLLSAIVALAMLLAPVAELAAQPAVPLSLLAAIGVAIVHELRERKEQAHATAS